MSALEDSLAFAMRAIGLPEPVREYHPYWCCSHRKSEHMDVRGLPPLCVRCDEESLTVDDGQDHPYQHTRDFRCDFAWPVPRLIVEVEGGTYTGGRHVTGKGFERDAEKYARLTLDGWTVLRVTRLMVTSGEALSMVEKALAKAATA